MSGLLAPRPWPVKLALFGMGLILVASLVSVLANLQSGFLPQSDGGGVEINLMDVLAFLLFGFFAAILVAVAVLIWRRNNKARIAYVLAALFGISADAGFVGGSGWVELACWIGAFCNVVLLFLPASNRWFRVPRV